MIETDNYRWLLHSAQNNNRIDENLKALTSPTILHHFIITKLNFQKT
jgi:hypothetical protein